MQKTLILTIYFASLLNVQNIYVGTNTSKNPGCKHSSSSYCSSSESISIKEIDTYIKKNNLCDLYYLLQENLLNEQAIMETACSYGNIIVVRLLMFEFQASPFIKNHYGKKPIDYCCSNEIENQTIALVGPALQYNGPITNPRKYAKNHYLEHYVITQCSCPHCKKKPKEIIILKPLLTHLHSKMRKTPRKSFFVVCGSISSGLS